MKYCAFCGQTIPDISVYCMFCGRKAEEEQKKEESPEQKFLAFSKFYFYGDRNFIMDQMLKENVKLVADRNIINHELVMVLDEMENGDYQKKILTDLVASGYDITSDLLGEIARWIGAEEAFRFALSLYRGEFTPEEVHELGMHGCSEKDMDDIIAHCVGIFSFDQIREILEFSGMGNRSLQRIIPTAIGKLTADDVNELFGLIDETMWPLFYPHIQRMDFAERLEVREMFGI